MFKPYDITHGSVNILIGPNGSGKSTLLRQWCEELKVSEQTVLAMSPSPYDRFIGMRGWNFKFYGPRQGRRATSDVMRDVIIKAYKEDPKVLKNVTQVLKYSKFQGRIGVRISKIRLHPVTVDSSIEEFIDTDFTVEMHQALQRWESESNGSGKVDFGLDEYSHYELSNLSLAVVLENEKLLKRLKLISKIEYFLYRDGGVVIPLMEACSGELSFIAGLSFIASNITKRAVVAIDEPENSLHPNWQKGYVEILLDLFHYYQPKSLIATHSPIIISGAQLEREKGGIPAPVNVYQVADMIPKPFAHEKLSLEEMYDRLFGIITPKNHHLSQVAVALLNEMNDGVRSFNSVLNELLSLKDKCYDESQKNAIDKFMKLAKKLKDEGFQNF